MKREQLGGLCAAAGAGPRVPGVAGPRGDGGPPAAGPGPPAADELHAARRRALPANMHFSSASSSLSSCLDIDPAGNNIACNCKGVLIMKSLKRWRKKDL